MTRKRATQARPSEGETVSPLEITPPPTVEFPKGIKLIRAEVTQAPTKDYQILCCVWEVHGRPKYSHVRAPAMIVLNDPHYWEDVLHQLAAAIQNPPVWPHQTEVLKDYVSAPKV